MKKRTATHTVASDDVVQQAMDVLARCTDLQDRSRPPLESWQAKLMTARELGSRLGGSLDALNEGLARAEEALASLKLGVAASVSLPGDHVLDLDAPNECLFFMKIEGAWRLLHGVQDAPLSETFTLSPLVNASRAKRLAAVSVLPELLGRMVEKAEREIEEVEAAELSLRAFVDTVNAT